MKYTEGSVKNSDSMGRSKYVNYSLKKMLQGKLMQVALTLCGFDFFWKIAQCEIRTKWNILSFFVPTFFESWIGPNGLLNLLKH